MEGIKLPNLKTPESLENYNFLEILEADIIKQAEIKET